MKARTRSGCGATAAVLAIAAAGLLAAHDARAQAPVGHIDGSPLDVYTDGLGHLQARFDGRLDGEFYSPSADPAHAGLEVVNTPPGAAFATLLTPTAVSGPTLSRPNSATQVLHAVYTENDDTGALYQVTEDVTFVNGSSDVRMHYVIQNLQGVPASFRAGEVADLFTGDSDSGTGLFDGTAPRFVGGRSPNGGTGGLREVTPWSHYQESQYGDVFSNFETSNTDPASGPVGLNDTVDPTSVDYGAGAEWDYAGVNPADTRTIDVTWHFTTGTVTPEQLQPPQYGKTVNALHSKGLVKIKVPHSNRFVTLAGGFQVPLGSVFDTTKGRVTLVSADKNGITQHSWFYQGIFKVGQTKGKKPITTLDLAGPKPQCGSSKGKKSSAGITRKRRRQRHLWGNGKGNFRTTGQFSSATVRGTIWLTQDTCKGTLVKVKRGKVAVKDFTRHKTFIVKAGHSHLAPRHK
jgi:hypothetical protein